MKMCARIPLGVRSLARGVQRGFTLIELMVVLVIIGLLAALTFAVATLGINVSRVRIIVVVAATVGTAA
ncbi:MAG TPA: prepilin-type N-terminal cleavage/methylation domain-containing protein, partial [Aquabacterium sp.]|nr:prepilin-type N-terminal cleavage/methylation domain-containing protein [Aquabacterium sp.]